MENNSGLVLGIDRHLVEEFLRLIRDRNYLVDKANVFLEQTGESGINVAIANQRDVLSHLATFLSVKNGNNETYLRAQISGAEEHFRRAIIEPYHIAYNSILDKCRGTMDRYRETVLPLLEKKKYSELANAPDARELREHLQHINKQYEFGRGAKALNHWNEEWTNRQSAFIEGYYYTTSLIDKLDSYIARAISIENRKTDWKLKILIAVISLIVGVIISFFVQTFV